MSVAIFDRKGIKKGASNFPSLEVLIEPH